MELRFIVASHCNANCYFCLNEYVGTKDPAYTVLPFHYGLAMQAARNLGVSDCTISGGEPTLRKDLADITRAVRKHSSRVTVISNGYLLNKRIDALKHIHELHVSFHSMYAEEWARVTEVKDGMEKVLRNLPIVREQYPNLRIKLNVVAEEQNSRTDQIEKYLEFAREHDLEISLFQEGYFSFLGEMGVADMGEVPTKAPWWNLEPFGAKLMSESERKRIYDVGGVKIALSYTSTDKMSWDSTWITPLGAGFVDVRHRTPLIDFMQLFEEAKIETVEDALKSLFSEAEIEVNQQNSLYKTEQGYLADKAALFQERTLNFPEAKPIPVSNLFQG